MFSRSAMALGVLATDELLVFILAVGRFGVVLLPVVVSALAAFGAVILFRQVTGIHHRSGEGAVSLRQAGNGRLDGPVLGVSGGRPFTFFGLPTSLFGGLLMPQPVRAAGPPLPAFRLLSAVADQPMNPFADLGTHRSRRDVVEVYSTMRDPQGSGTNPPAAPAELR